LQRRGEFASCKFPVPQLPALPVLYTVSSAGALEAPPDTHVLRATLRTAVQFAIKCVNLVSIISSCFGYHSSLQKHDVRCTEEFYAAQVKGVLNLEKRAARNQSTARDHSVGSESGHAECISDRSGIAAFDLSMMEQAFSDVVAKHDPHSSDVMPCDERITELQALVASTDSNLGLEMLQGAERKLFAAALRSGKLTTEQESWRPWWQYPLEQHRKVALLPADAGYSGVPCAFESSVPEFSSMATKAPSPSLLLNVIEVMYAYCHTMRLYCGDPEWDVGPAIDCVLALSGVLSSDARYDSFADVFNHCTKAAQEAAIRLSTGVNMLVPIYTFQDVSAVLSTRHYLCDALLHLQRLFVQPKSKRLRFLQKKLMFFSGWSADSGCVTDAALLEAVHAINSTTSERIGVICGDRHSTPLIQEVG
jgi:hypothetical protein